MKHYGDIQKIDGHKVPLVDIITAGSPCQDLSIAGKRAGLSGERSGLFMEVIRIIKEMHDESRRTNQPVRPRLLVFENVTGVLSSNDGEDFRTILEEVIHIVDPDSDVPRLAEGQSWSGVGCVLGDGWSLAWKVHDSQFWGVPQRRRRLCLVADFRGESAPEILFERKSLSRDLEQGGEEGKGTPEAVERSSDSANYTLKIRGGVETDSSGRSAGKGALIQKEVSACLNAVQDQTLFQDVPTVYGISPLESNSMKSSNPHSGIYEADTARTLDENGGNPNCNQGGMLVIENHPADSRCKVKDDGIVQTLNGRMGTGGGNVPLVMSYRGDNITSPTNQSNPQAGDPCHTLVNDDRNYVVLTEDHFGDYNESDTAASLRKSGGTLGGGWRVSRDTVGALQARDYKGVGDQYVREDKVIVQQKGEDQ